MQHELKIESTYFNDVAGRVKTWELRKNDRDFHYGDTLRLREIDSDGDYTGRECIRTVKYVYSSVVGTNFGLCEGYCIMSIE